MASLALTLSLLTPLAAHTTVQLEDWLTDWNRQAAEEGLTQGHIAEYRDVALRHRCQSPFPVCRSAVETRADLVAVHNAPPARVSGGVEQWRSLVAAYFAPELVDRMLQIMQCESKGDPYAVNPRSGATGLLQIMQSWQRSFPGDYTDPETNISVAAAIYNAQGIGAWRQCL